MIDASLNCKRCWTATSKDDKGPFVLPCVTRFLMYIPVYLLMVRSAGLHLPSCEKVRFFWRCVLTRSSTPRYNLKDSSAILFRHVCEMERWGYDHANITLINDSSKITLFAWIYTHEFINCTGVVSISWLPIEINLRNLTEYFTAGNTTSSCCQWPAVSLPF